ncbi:acyl-CoA dehydrogenase family protein [Saccharothrix variisporea]|uniref:Alkylation response protein AidB-like acyl-CoA dehydrogenase n=1 Tax=Saccharothrix variisporea TaxID=543527 RepID=A0A495XTN3_9PSEU|nr:acyl-CoA dehydrogenase family protein [Saccharothrix variisporea]RKT75048.1 alkylation response protein AidB-like acyl-CoA dehydrogenase [Saccharothrix variisporea]
MNANTRTDDLVERAAEIVPVLRKHAAWGEENRRLHDEVVAAMADADVLRLRVPARFGGHEADMRTVVAVLSELGRGDGSAAWVAAVWAISTWMVGMFPEQAQEEVFADPDVRVAGILSPSATAVPVDGGVVVDGRWGFNSGALHSRWNTNAALLTPPDGPPQPVSLLIPLADLEVVDDWRTSGLCASGSVTTVAKGLFVPQHRVLAMGPVIAGVHENQLGDAPSVYRTPFMPMACATIGAPAVGLARAAEEAFFERLPGRKITYTSYASQAEAPVTHLTVARARMLADESAFHAERVAAVLDEKSGRGDEWTVEERARARLDLGSAVLRAKESVELLSTAAGGSSVYTDVPVHRVVRDIQTIGLHAILHPDTNFELYGRVLCGLEPHTPYV